MKKLPKYVIVELNGNIVEDAMGKVGYQTYPMAAQKCRENPTWTIYTSDPFRPALEIDTNGNEVLQ